MIERCRKLTWDQKYAILMLTFIGGCFAFGLASWFIHDSWLVIAWIWFVLVLAITVLLFMLIKMLLKMARGK